MPAAPAQAHMPVGYPPQTLAGSFPRRLSAQGLGGGVGAGGEGRRSFEHPPGKIASSSESVSEHVCLAVY